MRTEGVQVAISVLFMSMSLDGYIAGPDDDIDHPGGKGFDRLHAWFGDFSRPSGAVGDLWDEWNPPGAILVGRRTVEQVDHWGGDNQGVPIFVPSHRPPDPSVANYPRVKYVPDGIESAMAQARAAAGNRIVLVHGAARSRPGCWMSCRSIRYRCCSVRVVACSSCCRRASNWRSSG